MPTKNGFNDLWLLQDDAGKISGPLKTDVIQKMILEGKLLGNEKLATYPDGDWKLISKYTEFYEALLSSLENPITRDEKNIKKMQAETVIVPANKILVSDSKNEEDNNLNLSLKNKDAKNLKLNIHTEPTQINLPTMHKPHQTESTAAKQQNLASSDMATIELKSLDQIEKPYRKKIIPFIATFIFLLLATTVYFLFEPDNHIKGWVLLAPQKGKAENISVVEKKKIFDSAVANLKSGTLENALLAQKYIVELIEKNPNNVEALGLLCMVHEILWPYTMQTTNDLRAISVTTQWIRTINPVSSYSDSCQIVNLLTKGQPFDAQSLVEKTLDRNNEEKFILFPFLYLIKGESYEESANYLNAEAYYSEAQKSFPGWNWALFAQARALMKMNKLNEARQTFEKILSQNSNYKAALYGLGLVEVKQQGNQDKAFNYFNQGFLIKSILPKTFHLEALHEYIKILLAKQDKKKALEVAQFGLNLSPSHKVMKEIVLSLGGDDHVDNPAQELIYLGDQFARVGDHLAAQAQYKAAFDIDSKNAQVALKAAKSLWKINQSSDAILWIDKALMADSKLATAYALKADYLSQKFNFIEATRVIFEAQRKFPNNFDLLKAQAQIEYRKNNMLGSMASAEKAMKLYDSDAELLALLANANVNVFMNAPSRSKEEEEAKAKFIKDALRYSGKAVDLEPALPETQISYARFLNAASGSVAAENYFKKLISAFPYSVDYKIGLAEFYQSEEKHSAAIGIYEALYSADAKNKKAVMGLAKSYQATNNPKMAQKYYLVAAVLDPSDVEPLFATGQLELETVNSRNSDSAIKSALAKFEIVKKINPNYPRISYFLARCYYEIGEFAKAIEFVNEEKKLNPGLADPYLLAAAVYTAKEQFKECSAEYTQAIKIRPNSAELYVQAAICYRKSDSLDIAQDMLDIAKQKESGYATIYREQGYLYERRGQPRDAKKSFELYLELSPNAFDRSVVQARIDALGG